MKRRHFINEVTRDTWLLFFYHICTYELLRYRFSIQSNCPKIIVCHFMPVIAIPIRIDPTSIYGCSIGRICMNAAWAQQQQRQPIYIRCNIWLFRYILFAHIECEMTVVIDYNSYFISICFICTRSTFPSLPAVVIALFLSPSRSVLLKIQFCRFYF